MASTAKSTGKKTAVKKTAPVKPATKKTAAKGDTPKKAPSKTLKPGQASTKKPDLPLTRIVAHKDVGWGNALYIRGEGDGLSWEKGILMKSQSATEWSWSSSSAKGSLCFKFLVNDTLWASGENLTIKAGSTWEGSPDFNETQPT
jgi:hypothetical protein